LNIVVSAFVSVDEVLKEKRNVAQLRVATPAQLRGDVGRNTLRPALCRIKCDNATGALALSREQVADDRFQVSGFFVGLPPNSAIPAEIVHHEIDRLIVALRHDRGRSIGLTHHKLHATADSCRGRLSQGPSQGDEGYKDDCDDSDEGSGTVNVRHDVPYLQMPVESCNDHRPPSRRSVREGSC
jgi:hypothetical protein